MEKEKAAAKDRESRLDALEKMLHEDLPEEDEEEDMPSLSDLQKSIQKAPAVSEVSSNDEELIASLSQDGNFKAYAAVLYSYIPNGYKQIRSGFIKHLAEGDNAEIKREFIEQWRGCPSIVIDDLVAETREILQSTTYKSLIKLDISKTGKQNKAAKNLSAVSKQVGVPGFSKCEDIEVPWLSLCICSTANRQGKTIDIENL